MTTPGGVPNLPAGALTIETLASKTQDASVEANRERAVERVSGIFHSSTGGDPSSDLSPFGFLMQLFSGFNSLVAKADPADITGPDDLPGLLVDFIEELPFVGQFVSLWQAINGSYDGEDEDLLAINEYFVDMASHQEEVQAAWVDLFAAAWATLTSDKTLAQKLGDLQAAWDAFAFTIAGVEADQTLTIVKVLQQLLPGLIPEGSELPTGIRDLQAGELAKRLAWNVMLQAGWEALTNNSLTFPQKIAALQVAWDAFAEEMGDIHADQTLTIQGILNQFIPGLFPDGENPTGLQLAQDFFDDVRRHINQLAAPWRIGYFDDAWVWVPSLTTPTTELPGGEATLAPGVGDVVDGVSWRTDPSIPPAPTGLVAVPHWDLTGPNFPAGRVTYAVAAVKGGVEGPASRVTVVVGTLFPPNASARVDLAWNSAADTTWRVYREVDNTYEAQAWRLVATPATAPTWLSPLSDKTVRTGGTVAAPKSDAELAAQIVTEVQSAASSAQSTASSAQSTANSAQSTANSAASTASSAQSAATSAGNAASNAQSTANSANNAATAAQTGVANITNAVTSGATGNDITDADAEAAEAAVADLRGSLAGLQSQMDELQAGTGGPAGGVKFTAQQIGWQPGGGTNWDIFGTGSPLLTNLLYSWTKTGAGRYVHGIYKTTKLTSAQQSVTLVFQTAPAFPTGFNPKTYGGSNILICRANTAGTVFPFLQVWANRAQFGYWNGSRNMVGSDFAIATAGAGVTFRQIDASSPYKFEAVQNGVVLATHTFTAGQAPHGANYLSVGQGMVSGTGAFGDEFAPGVVNSFSARDAGAGAGLVASGIGGMIRRTLTGTVSIGAAINTTVAAPFFDDTDWVSAGVHRRISGQAGFDVDEGGLFFCHAGFYKPSFANHWGGVSFYSGAPGTMEFLGWQAMGQGAYMVGSGLVHVQDGQSICPAVINYSDTAFNVTGQATGRMAYFGIARVG